MNLSYKNLFLLLLWLTLGTLSFFLIDEQNIHEPYKIAIIYVGSLIIIHGLFYFNKHGGPFLTPTTLFLLFSTLLIGFAAIYVNFEPIYKITKGHYIGVLTGFIVQIVTYFVFLNQKDKLNNNIPSIERVLSIFLCK